MDSKTTASLPEGLAIPEKRSRPGGRTRENEQSSVLGEKIIDEVVANPGGHGVRW